MTTGILHVYKSSLNLLEHLPSFQGNNYPPPKHVLLFVGGLFHNFNLTQYVNDIAALFPLHNKQTWRVMEIQLSSNGRSWGISNIDRDVEDIATCVSFIRGSLFKDESIDIVLMGHSTGCQDVMRYLTAPNPITERNTVRSIVQGAILQAAVSDRDGALNVIEEGPEIKKAFDRAMSIAKSTPAEEARDTILPMDTTKLIFGPAPMSVARWLSLISPDSPRHPSTEDFFSNDLSEATLRKTFGSIGRNKLLHRPTGEGPRDLQYLLVLLSDSDEYVRPQVKQKELLQKWKSVMREETGASIHGDSAVIMNATHDVGGDDWPSKEARLVVLRKKVLHYLKEVVGDVGQEAYDIWHKDGDKVMAMKVGDGRSIEDQVGVLKL